MTSGNDYLFVYFETRESEYNTPILDYRKKPNRLWKVCMHVYCKRVSLDFGALLMNSKMDTVVRM